MFGIKTKTDLDNKLTEIVKQLDINGLKSIGISLLQTIKNYVMLESQLEKEYKTNGGWL